MMNVWVVMTGAVEVRVCVAETVFVMVAKFVVETVEADRVTTEEMTDTLSGKVVVVVKLSVDVVAMVVRLGSVTVEAGSVMVSEVVTMTVTKEVLYTVDSAVEVVEGTVVKMVLTAVAVGWTVTVCVETVVCVV